MEIIGAAVIILLAAAVGESVIEFVAKPLVKRALRGDEREEDRKIVYNLLSALLGIGIALNFGLGLFKMVGAYGQILQLDMILTGILIGRGSNWVHDFVTRYILGGNEQFESAK